MLQYSRFVPILLVILLTSCGGDRFHVDTDAINLDLQLRRMDVELFHLEPSAVPEYHANKVGAGDIFYEEYIEAILKAGPMEGDSLTVPRLQRFLLDPNWNSAQSSVETVFGDMASQKRNLETVFKRYSAYFPNENVPEIVIFNSGYNYAIYPMDSMIGIGIEWFIGENEDVVKRLAPEAFPNFVKRRMRPEYLITSTMTGWLFVHHYVDLDGQDLLANMVHHGKVIYALDKILGDMPDSLKIGYPQQQLDWCEENEFNVWAELAVNDVLFSKKE